MKKTLPFPIKDSIIIDDYKIVLLDKENIPTSSPYINRNVLCLNTFEEVIWQIEELSHYPGNSKFCPYSGIHFIDGILILINWCDLKLRVDYKTGKIIEMKQQK